MQVERLTIDKLVYLNLKCYNDTTHIFFQDALQLVDN